MKSFAFLAATLALPLLATNASATLVAGWNFNSLAITTAGTPGSSAAIPTSIAASSGAGTLDLTNWAGNVASFGGSTVNLTTGDAAGASLSLAGGGTAAPFPGNGGFITISISLTGFEDAVVTFATQRTSTGFNSDQFSYSIDGGANYTNVGSPYTPASAYALQTFDLSTIPALDNASSVIFKISFDGDTSTSGNNRIDNLQVNANPVPEPAAAALGLLGLAGILRRRRA